MKLKIKNFIDNLLQNDTILHIILLKLGFCLSKNCFKDKFNVPKESSCFNIIQT